MDYAERDALIARAAQAVGYPGDIRKHQHLRPQCFHLKAARALFLQAAYSTGLYSQEEVAKMLGFKCKKQAYILTMKLRQGQFARYMPDGMSGLETAHMILQHNRSK